MGLSQHPLAKRYRSFSDGEMVRLRESVARLGVIEPVTILDGLVLDGWHRLQVSQELGVVCPTRDIWRVGGRHWGVVSRQERGSPSSVRPSSGDNDRE